MDQSPKKRKSEGNNHKFTEESLGAYSRISAIVVNYWIGYWFCDEDNIFIKLGDFYNDWINEYSFIQLRKTQRFSILLLLRSERIYKRSTNSRIYHFLPECIAFNQSTLREFLPESIAPRTTQRCHTVFSRGFQWEILLWFTSVKRCEGDRDWLSQKKLLLLLLFLMQWRFVNLDD